MSHDGFAFEVTIERFPYGNFIMKNERGYIISEVIRGSELAKVIEEQLERGLFTLRVQLEKP